jgi:hypothetical protein
MTIVKVQRPQVTSDAHQPWLIYDKLRARECQIPEAEIPTHIHTIMLNRPGMRTWKSFFDNAVWDKTKRTWDLSKATLTKDKQW